MDSEKADAGAAGQRGDNRSPMDVSDLCEDKLSWRRDEMLHPCRRGGDTRGSGRRGGRRGVLIVDGGEMMRKSGRRQVRGRKKGG